MVTIQVPPEILDQTDKCWMDFSCLDEGKCACEVLCRASENMVFVRGTAAVECLYAVRYGDNYVCQCPTHYYLCTSGQLRRTPQAPSVTPLSVELG